MNKHLLVMAALALFMSCNKAEQPSEPVTEELNPAAEGFNQEGSDDKAVALADSVMKAMGGRKNYDDLRYIAWNFFGARDLVWDKHTGRVRIEVPSRNTTYLVNINTQEGKVMKDGAEITNPDSLALYLERAKDIWINDSYWLVMPFKLKDSGVTLKYARQDTTLGGLHADVLSLTFKNVGSTPNNKYEVYIDKSDHLVKQWAYFEEAEQDTASATWPWDNYKEYEGVLLSSDRSDGKGPHQVRVFKALPDEVFNEFKKPNLENE